MNTIMGPPLNSTETLMNPNRLFVVGDRRRLVNLSTRPLFQLKLPITLLLISSLFLVVFLAHTYAAYGKLIAAGFEHAFLAELATEIRFDYLVVSATLGIAWALAMMGACLAVTHHYLGPIVALRRQIAHLKRGEYSTPSHVRSGHPLRAVADELDGLAKLLSGEDLQVLEESKGIVLLGEASPAPNDAPLLADESALAIETQSANAATPWVGWYSRSASATS